MAIFYETLTKYIEYVNDNITHCCEEIDTLKNKADIDKKERNLEFWRGCYDAACVLRREYEKEMRGGLEWKRH